MSQREEKQIDFRGDIDSQEFRRLGRELIDWAAELLDQIENHKVLPDIQPGDIKNILPSQAPHKPDTIDDIRKDLDRIILPGMTHWNHPNFFAYFCSSGSFPGILADLVSTTLNNNGMLWKSCPASTELEQVTLEWLRQMLGLPDDYWGIIYDTGSTSTLHALAAARETLTDLDIREKGLTGRDDLPQLRIYISEHAHSSVDKAVLALGIGVKGIRRIPGDAEFRMNPDALAEAISKDRRAGVRPFCVVATIGTTSTASIDPVDKIAGICEKENIWLHVDAAYAGSAAILPELKTLFAGWERADSVLINPHKWLFVPIDCSVLFTRKPDILKRAFSLVPEYLRTDKDAHAENYMDYGIPLGRRFRSLKLWFVMRCFGQSGLTHRIRYHIELAKNFADWIDAHPVFKRTTSVHFGLVCFRAHPQGMESQKDLNEFNEGLLAHVNETRDVFLSHTIIDGAYILRIAVGNLRTEERHVRQVQEILQASLDQLQ